MKKLITSAAICFSLGATSTAFAAEDLGRLFTTPSERASLDHLRKTTKLPTNIPLDQPAGEAAAPVMPLAVSIQGYVKRGDGKKGTVWLNGEPVQEGADLGEMKVGKMRRNGNQVPIQLQAGGKNLNLKAGQSYDPETNSVSEINAHAEKTAKDEIEESGTIGSNPTGSSINKSSLGYQSLKHE
jgi:hypothetical protein